MITEDWDEEAISQITEEVTSKYAKEFLAMGTAVEIIPEGYTYAQCCDHGAVLADIQNYCSVEGAEVPTAVRLFDSPGAIAKRLKKEHPEWRSDFFENHVMSFGFAANLAILSCIVNELGREEFRERLEAGLAMLKYGMWFIKDGTAFISARPVLIDLPTRFLIYNDGWKTEASLAG